jgi:exosortase K
MLTFLALRFLDKHLHKILSIPIAFVSAFILTIFVNASRIFVSIIVQPQANYLLPGKQHFIHETIGIVTNLSFLILIYYLIEKQLIKKQGHAKFA